MLVVLTKSIQFMHLSKLKVFPIGSTVYVDTKNNLAYADSIHFDIQPNEYTYLQ